MSRDLKYTKENVELRRGKVLELSAKGYSQNEISKMLNVSEGLISLDMQYIREQARESIKSYSERILEEYNDCMVGLRAILKESWNISKNTADLLTNVTVVEDVIKFVNNAKDKRKSEVLPHCNISEESESSENKEGRHKDQEEGDLQGIEED